MSENIHRTEGKEGMSTMIRKAIAFYGRVQGVGFRYRARHAAGALGLTGWVENEYDGSVSMEVQGDETLIDRMLVTLNRDRYIDIQNMECRSIPLVEEERDFHIR